MDAPTSKTLVAEMTDEELKELIIAKEAKLRLLFPEEWVKPTLQDLGLRIMFNFKLNGLDWRNEEEFVRICAAMTKLRIIEVNTNTMMLRRAPHIVNQH